MDMMQFAEAATAFKTALDSLKILKGLKGVSGDKIAEEELSKLQGIIIAAQQSAIAANFAQFQLTDEKRALEEKISQFETWDRDKKRYLLTDVGRGIGPVFVMALKAEAASGEPFHVLCAKCFEHRQRSILQATTELRMRYRVHVCMECKSEYVYGSLTPASLPAQAITEYDPFKEM